MRHLPGVDFLCHATRVTSPAKVPGKGRRHHRCLRSVPVRRNSERPRRDHRSTLAGNAHSEGRA